MTSSARGAGKTSAAKDCKMRAKAARAQELLIQAAKTLFCERGYDGVSVKELCDYSSLNVSLVSYYFGGKEGLYQACLEKYGEKKLASARRILQAPKSKEEFLLRLRMFLDEMIQNYLEEPQLTRIIHRDIELDNPLTKNVFEEKFLQVFKIFIEFFTAAKKNKILRYDVDPQTYAQFFVAIMTHTHRTDHLNKRHFGKSVRDPAYREELSKQILNLFTQGMLAAPQTAAKE